MTGLIKSGGMRPEDKPVWYDVMAAFPPKVEPIYHRPPQDKTVVDIIYKEDIVRAKYYEVYGNRAPIDLTDTKTVITSERFIKKFLEIEKDPEKATDETFDTVVEQLRSEGLILKSLKDMKRQKEEARLDDLNERRDIELEQRRKMDEFSRQPLSESLEEDSLLNEIDLESMYEDKTLH